MDVTPLIGSGIFCRFGSVRSCTWVEGEARLLGEIRRWCRPEAFFVDTRTRPQSDGFRERAECHRLPERHRDLRDVNGASQR